MRICDLIKDQETYHAELGQSVLETVRAMVERNIGAVPVIHSGKLVGIFSERDLMRDMSDSKGHGEDGESERQSHACESNADSWESRCQNCGPATAKNQPECSKEFRRCAFTDRHGNPSF